MATEDDPLVIWAKARAKMNPDEEPGIGPFIRALRLGRGYTQEELGEMLDPPFSQSEISSIENGKIKLPTLARVRQLAAALGVTPYDFLEQSGWTGAATRYKDEPLPPEMNAATSRYRKELIELLPRLRGSDIRSLIQIAKKMARETEAE